jgi:hypothetical protein
VPQSNRLDIDVSFSTAGGVEIEENWDKVKTITIPTAESITGAAGDGLGLRAVAATYPCWLQLVVFMCELDLSMQPYSRVHHRCEWGAPRPACISSYISMLLQLVWFVYELNVEQVHLFEQTPSQV